ncbi:MAG TPA: amidohydrolase [Firmicutes bacterium]|nr:amidohydrolase [Bacillota bacterium]
MLITNAKIYTMEACGVIENGFIHVQDGKIAAVGPMADMPDLKEEEVIDVAGKNVFPGFVEAHCHVGVEDEGLNFEGNDGNEITDPTTPTVRALDSYYSLDRACDDALYGGVTTVLTTPGSANPIGGQMMTIKMGTSDDVEQKAIHTFNSMKFALGENPKRCYNGRKQTPMTRMGSASVIREQLEKARRYMIEKENAEKKGEKGPAYDAKCEALIPVLKREVRAHFHCHRSDDIMTAIRIGKEFNLDQVIVHGTEGYLIADTLAKANVPVITGPYLSNRSKPECTNLSPKNPAILTQAGCLTAICTDHPVIPIHYLPLCAGIAVKEGLDYMKALECITINAAKIACVDDRVGSIKVGKDADLTIYDGDPLSVYAVPEAVFVDGKRVR